MQPSKNSRRAAMATAAEPTPPAPTIRIRIAAPPSPEHVRSRADARHDRYGFHRVRYRTQRIRLRKGRRSARILSMSESILDEINKKIIEYLQRDGRMSYAAL